MSSVNPLEYLGEHKEFLQRYNSGQLKVIFRYWEQVRWTRKAGTLAENVVRAEVNYWNNFEPGEVIKALEIHLNTPAYKMLRENYTRGILRNIKSAAPSSAGTQVKTSKNKFHNYQQRDYTKEELECAGKNTVNKYFESHGGLDEAEARAKKFLEDRNKRLESKAV
ncbi:MAG TPA: hypothetical protein DC000_02715 [Clostridiales bacterium]|nr:hypothetical protein [Clostridiales bacterium]